MIAIVGGQSQDTRCSGWWYDDPLHIDGVGTVIHKRRHMGFPKRRAQRRKCKECQVWFFASRQMKFPRCRACQAVWAKENEILTYSHLSGEFAKAEAGEMSQEEGERFVRRIMLSLAKGRMPVRHRLLAWLLWATLRSCPTRKPARIR